MKRRRGLSQRAQPLSIARGSKRVAPPGTKFDYSGGSSVLLARALPLSALSRSHWMSLPRQYREQSAREFFEYTAIRDDKSVRWPTCRCTLTNGGGAAASILAWTPVSTAADRRRCRSSWRQPRSVRSSSALHGMRPTAAAPARLHDRDRLAWRGQGGQGACMRFNRNRCMKSKRGDSMATRKQVRKVRVTVTRSSTDIEPAEGKYAKWSVAVGEPHLLEFPATLVEAPKKSGINGAWVRLRMSHGQSPITRAGRASDKKRGLTT